MTNEAHRAALDAREQTFLIASGRNSLRLFLRMLPAADAPRGSVLYFNGVTFPSALSVAYRFDNGSWRDALSAADLDVWAFDLS